TGAGLDAVHAAATAAVEKIFTYVYLHRVDDLRRSGRIGAATSFLSTALSTRTLLRLGGGELQLREKARIPSKALGRLVDSVIEELGERRARIAVQHHHAPDRADGLAETLTERLGERLVEVTVGEFGPVMGLHLGRGAAGVAVLPDDDGAAADTPADEAESPSTPAEPVDDGPARARPSTDRGAVHSLRIAPPEGEAAYAPTAVTVWRHGGFGGAGASGGAGAADRAGGRARRPRRTADTTCRPRRRGRAPRGRGRPGTAAVVAGRHRVRRDP